MSIIPFPGHKFRSCGCHEAGCMFCDGWLSACVTCGCFEGMWTTDCPGERMTPEQGDAVYAGKLDYRIDRGWVEEASPGYYKSPELKPWHK